MYKYCYTPLNLSDNIETSTSSEDVDIQNDNRKNNKINYKLLNKKPKIKYVYTHYTTYIFYNKISKSNIK